MFDPNNDPVLQRVATKIQEHTAEIAELKAFANKYLKLQDQPPLYTDVDTVALAITAYAPTVHTRFRLRADEFYNKPLAGAVRAILEMNKAAGRGPMSVDEIHDVLVQGGFNFTTGDVESQKQGVRISLAKNSVTFSRLPNDLFGLAEWYGQRPRKPRKNGNLDSAGDAQAPGEDGATPNEAARIMEDK